MLKRTVLSGTRNRPLGLTSTSSIDQSSAALRSDDGRHRGHAINSEPSRSYAKQPRTIRNFRSHRNQPATGAPHRPVDVFGQIPNENSLLFRFHRQGAARFMDQDLADSGRLADDVRTACAGIPKPNAGRFRKRSAERNILARVAYRKKRLVCNAHSIWNRQRQLIPRLSKRSTVWPDSVTKKSP